MESVIRVQILDELNGNLLEKSMNGFALPSNNEREIVGQSACFSLRKTTSLREGKNLYLNEHIYIYFYTYAYPGVCGGRFFKNQ